MYFRDLAQVQDLYECRIIALLDTMASTLLLDLPPTDTWTSDSFLAHSQVTCDLHPCIYLLFFEAI